MEYLLVNEITNVKSRLKISSDDQQAVNTLKVFHREEWLVRFYW